MKPQLKTSKVLRFAVSMTSSEMMAPHDESPTMYLVCMWKRTDGSHLRITSPDNHPPHSDIHYSSPFCFIPLYRYGGPPYFYCRYNRRCPR